MPSDASSIPARDVPTVLRRMQILAGVSEPTIERIAALSRAREVDEGDILYSVGDPARNVYVICNGRLRFTLGGDGRPAAGGSVIRPGDILGWAALLADQPRRIATVAALEPSRLLEIDGRQLLEVLEEDPRAGFLVMQRLARMITQSFLEQSTLLSSVT